MVYARLVIFDPLMKFIQKFTVTQPFSYNYYLQPIFTKYYSTKISLNIYYTL